MSYCFDSFGDGSNIGGRRGNHSIFSQANGKTSRMGIENSKQRLRSLMGGSVVLWLALRPAYWPFADFSAGEQQFWWKCLNAIVWACVLYGVSIVVDLLVVEWSKRRNIRQKSSQSLPHPFWSALAAALLGRIFIGSVFSGRPLPDGSEEFFATVRYWDIAAITTLPAVIWLARRVGPPSQWSFVKNMKLQPPK